MKYINATFILDMFNSHSRLESQVKMIQKVNSFPNSLNSNISFGARKLPTTVSLSKNDILTILGQTTQKKNLNHDVVEVCQRLTGREKITPSVVQQCFDALIKENETFGIIAQSIKKCLKGRPTPVEIANNIIKQRQRLNSVVISKQNPKYKMQPVKIDENKLAEEAKLLQEQRAKELEREAQKAAHKEEQIRLAKEKAAQMAFSKANLDYVKRISESNVYHPPLPLEPRAVRVERRMKEHAQRQLDLEEAFKTQEYTLRIQEPAQTHAKTLAKEKTAKLVQEFAD